MNNIGLIDLQASYDARFRKDQIKDSDSFYKWVLTKLNPQKGRLLVDVACGSGRLLRSARKAGLETVGVDFSIGAIELARVLAPEATLIQADGQNLPLSENIADYVTNLGSLEHFVNPEKGLREIFRVLSPDGISAIFLPNAYYLADLIWWVWRKGKAASHKQPIERFAAYADWRDLLERNGLDVFKSYNYNFMLPRSRLDLQHYHQFPRKLFYLAISPFVPFNFSYSFLYLCRKAT